MNVVVPAGMAELYESEQERATVLTWGNQSPKLAWGTASGTVRMALVNSPAGVIHVRTHLYHLIAPAELCAVRTCQLWQAM